MSFIFIIDHNNIDFIVIVIIVITMITIMITIILTITIITIINIIINLNHRGRLSITAQQKRSVMQVREIRITYLF